MSKSTATVEYHCLNDCRREGCPGHEIDVILERTSDTVRVQEVLLWDVANIPKGQIVWFRIFDQHAWEAAVQAWCELTGQELIPAREVDEAFANSYYRLEDVK